MADAAARPPSSVRRSVVWLVMLGCVGSASLLDSTGCTSTEYDKGGSGTKTATGGQTSATQGQGGNPAIGGARATTAPTAATGGVVGSSSAQAGSAGLPVIPSLGGAVGATSTVAAAGGAAAGDAAAGGATQCSGDPNLYGPADRPQLTDAAAANYTIRKYLARGGTLDAPVQDNWDPTGGLGNIANFTPVTYTVAADGTGTHTSIQAALNDAAASSDTTRAYIKVKPGTYREVVCVKGTRPITLFGDSIGDPSLVTIVYGNNADKPIDTNVNPCVTVDAAATQYGIHGSATFAVLSNQLQLKTLTISNDFDETGLDVWTRKLQAVALLTYGDRIVAENVRILGNHYTLAVESPNAATVSRVYILNGYIAGDMQYIVGSGTAVFDNSEIHFLTSRLTVDQRMGSILAASTTAANAYGFLVNRCRFTVATNSGFDWVLLGRSWDVDTNSYLAGTKANGQIVIRETYLGSHISMTKTWGNALETSRLFDCHDNRLAEYLNEGPAAAHL